MNYDNSATALFHPELQAPLLTNNFPASEHALCAELSRLAYWRYENEGLDDQGKFVRKEFTKILVDAGFNHLVLLIDARTGTQGFAATRGGKAYVVFRGSQTDEPADIFIDGFFWPVPWRGKGCVHNGFLASYQGIEGQLNEWLKKHQDMRVYFTGHSLGAAIATLAAAIHTNSTLITFGSPRVGDKEFAQVFDLRDVRRYVNHADLVTRVPPDSLPFATSNSGASTIFPKIVYFAHVQGMRYLDANGKEATGKNALTKFEHASNSVSFNWRLQVRGMWDSNETTINSRSLTDHAPINYLRAVLDLPG
ncbi:lipase family protein [Undibacterium umbellatum]|uniref:Lipase family protein n=1 Tax=Undibacterium umbellatum TaxID=2762300 RepID=A0ABR6Z8L0_9BURK|nr:lipase family protein [Undibacterium umbellatum]MBC3908090.1 lipase family protein [Undibacterium umbellatum]